MSDAGNVTKSLRERLGGNAEDRLGRALSELLESPLLTGALGRAFDAREKAAQAQEVAMGALNLPSAADIERLTRRLRAVSHRLEGIEDGVDRLDRALSPSGVEARLSAIETHLATLTDKLDRSLRGGSAAASARAAAGSAQGSSRARGSGAGARATRASSGQAGSRTPKQARAAKHASAAKQVRAAKEAKAARETSGKRPAGAARAAKAARSARTPGARARAARGTPGKA
jgi:hypothetical protein